MLPANKFSPPPFRIKSRLNPISAYITGLEITPLPLKQGQTTTVKIQANQPISITGSLAGHSLNFYQNADGDHIALQGIYGREDLVWQNSRSISRGKTW